MTVAKFACHIQLKKIVDLQRLRSAVCVLLISAGSAAHGKQQMAISAVTQPQMRSFFVSSKATELSTKVTTAGVRFAHSPKKTTRDYVHEQQ